MSCLVLHTPLAGRTLPAGEGGCAAGWLPPAHYLKLGPAVRSRLAIPFAEWNSLGYNAARGAHTETA
jgi:hypothetical protein